MSVKRQATTELNHTNWDQDDPADHEEPGNFKIASKDILEKRVIRTAKRRTQANGDEPNKSVFSGFGGFNKTQPASFDFLSKLTNGSNDNNNPQTKADSSEKSNLFGSNPTTGPGLFSLQTSTPSKSPFGSPSTSKGNSLFGVSSTNSNTALNMFTTSKADSTVGDSPFKLLTVTSSTDNNTAFSKATTTSISSTKVNIPASSSSTTSVLPSTFNTSPFNNKSLTNTVQSNFGTFTKSDSKSNETEKKSDDTTKKSDEAKMKYYSKLKGLNESVSDWIKKHVEQTPLCILTPIFKDYEKYLKQIQDEYQDAEKKENTTKDNKTTETKTDSEGSNAKPMAPTTNATVATSSLFGVSPNSKSLFAPQTNNIAPKEPATFSFGIKTPTSTSSTTKTSPTGISFGVATTTSSVSTTTTSSFSAGTSSSLFSFATNTNTTTATNGSAAPFSFGIGKTFTFNSSVKQNPNQPTEEPTKEVEEDDTPPKVEYTPVVEENSVYDKKCKIFVKKDSNFVDKGVGTLYIKKVEESGKHQLLVRANTNLGTILVNLILVSGIPTQRMGKNNVMMVCIPTPDSKPPPTPILIRVKTSEEADELLATLDKYKT